MGQCGWVDAGFVDACVPFPTTRSLPPWYTAATNGGSGGGWPSGHSGCSRQSPWQHGALAESQGLHVVVQNQLVQLWLVDSHQNNLAQCHNVGLIALQRGYSCQWARPGWLLASTWGFQHSRGKEQVGAQNQAPLGWKGSTCGFLLECWKPLMKAWNWPDGTWPTNPTHIPTSTHKPMPSLPSLPPTDDWTGAPSPVTSCPVVHHRAQCLHMGLPARVLAAPQRWRHITCQS